MMLMTVGCLCANLSKLLMLKTIFRCKLLVVIF